jgi:hypothetical protein
MDVLKETMTRDKLNKKQDYSQVLGVVLLIVLDERNYFQTPCSYHPESSRSGRRNICEQSAYKLSESSYLNMIVVRV